MPTEYKRLPTAPTGTDDTETDSNEDTSDGENTLVQESQPTHRIDPRFEQPTPSPWKRAALILLILFLFWLATFLRKSSNQPNIIHSDRYSKEYKFRPAASPVITERLKSGRTRVKGAHPSA